MSTGPSSVCVLADWTLAEWQVQSLERLLEEDGVEIPLVVVDESTVPEANHDAMGTALDDALDRNVVGLARKIYARRAWSLLVLERKLGDYFGDGYPLRKRRQIVDVECLDGADVRSVTPKSDGAWNELPEPTVEEIASRCDVAVRYGFGLIRGDILEAPEYGVLSFHPADIRRYRGMGTPKAFVDGRSSIGTTLQRLNEDIDAGEIVALGSVDVRDSDSLWDVWERQLALQIELLADGIRNLRDPSFEPATPDVAGPYHSPYRKKDADFALRLLAKSLRGRAVSGFRRLETASGVDEPTTETDADRECAYQKDQLD